MQQSYQQNENEVGKSEDKKRAVDRSFAMWIEGNNHVRRLRTHVMQGILDVKVREAVYDLWYPRRESERERRRCDGKDM
jgi:hypothetical protein